MFPSVANAVNIPRLAVRKLAPCIGAEITGIDLSAPIDDDTFRKIEREWHEHAVLLFRDQDLDDMQQVRFAERFGPLAHTLKQYEGTAHPAIMYVTNERKDGKYIGALPDGEMFFHSDMCYLEQPCMAALLHAIAIPPEGGNTVFASMVAAYESLPVDLKSALEGRMAMHSLPRARLSPTGRPQPSARLGKVVKRQPAYGVSIS